MATAAKSKSKKKADTNLLNVVYVWDMSYSMASVVDATREGTAQYLFNLQADEKKLVKKSSKVFTRLSLTAFDTVFEPWVANEPIADVDVDQVIGRYEPRGYTALYDAIAHTILETEKRMRDEKREQEKVLVIVMTDGGENSSKEYSLHNNGRQRIFDLITSYQEKGNWTFVYLGANVDSYAEAGAMGIARGNTGSYAATPASVEATMDSLSHVTSTRRAGASGQTVTAFADAGQKVDYRDVLTSPDVRAQPKLRRRSPQEKPYADSGSASDATRNAR